MVAVPARAATVTAGSVAKSGDFNGVAASTNFGLYDRPIAKAHQTTAQAIATSTFTALALDVTDVDSDGMRSGTGANTDRMVCRTQGWYLVMGVAAFSPNATGTRVSAVTVNGSYIDGGVTSFAAASSNSVATSTVLLHLMVNDYVQVLAYQNSGVSLNTDVADAGQQCTLSLIHMLAG